VVDLAKAHVIAVKRLLADLPGTQVET